MTDCFLGELRLFAHSRIPAGWIPCNGQLLNVAQYTALYALIGNTFGGQAPNTFQLPDLRGRAPVGADSRQADYKQGVQNGVENVLLNQATVPPHQHQVMGYAATSTLTAPLTNNYLGNIVSSKADSTTNFSAFNKSGANPDTTLNADSVSAAGGNSPHANMQPYAVASYCIATQGVFPPRN